MTTDIETAPASATLEGVKGNHYLRLWRQVPRELGFLLLTLPIAVIGFGLGMLLVSGGTGTIVTIFIGVFVFIGAFYVARAFGTLELIRLGWAGRPPIARPQWDTRPGFWGWLRSVFSNGHYWLYLLYMTLVNYLVSIVTWTVTVVWLSQVLGGISQWFWDRFIPRGEHYPDFLSHWLFVVFGGDPASRVLGGMDFRMLDHILFAILGLIALATLPYITHTFVLLHHAVARAMLGAFPSDALKRQLRDVSESRGAAISAEGHSLRRLERDIHDGPQQRLVRLQMDLAAAERKLGTDPDAARTLIAGSRTLTQEALEELRALSRGFAPPILLDRGLVAALESLASRSSLSVTVTNTLGSGVELPQEIERNAYFVASELVVNAAKHSGATAVGVALAARQVPEHDGWWLDVTVTDDGNGGAVLVEGHGLTGLEERLRGLGGTLELVSPHGGPTAITGRFPVTH